jgi:hypothetical protein
MIGRGGPGVLHLFYGWLDMCIMLGPAALRRKFGPEFAGDADIADIRVVNKGLIALVRVDDMHRAKNFWRPHYTQNAERSSIRRHSPCRQNRSRN